MRYILSPAFLLILLCNFSIAQKTMDTIYFNEKWQKSNNKDFKYYRVSKKIDSHYQVTNYYKNGRVQMESTYLSLDPEIKDGICTWYKRNGSISQTIKYSKYKLDTFHYSEQKDLINNTYDYCLKNKSVDSIQKIINSNKITDTQLYALAYTSKAKLLSKIYSDKILKYAEGDRDETGRKVVNEILESYKKAIDTSGVNKLGYQCERLGFLKKIKDTTLIYKNDLKELRANQPKEEYSFLNFGINFMKGKHNWIGGEVALMGISEENTMAFKQKDTIVIKRLKSGLGGVFIVSYLKNIDNTDYDLSFSLFQITSPMFLNVTKFGFQKSQELGKKYWYYRPEIGLGWGWFSVYYSYNFMFKKEAYPVSEKNLINVKITLPILKLKKR